jgi:hypothetical protein
MNNHLQEFKKPDRDFLKDKDCLICLETVDVEMNLIVALPCNCANSAYHITCITQMLQSGDNKNFCPHCKTAYQFCMPLVPLVPLLPSLSSTVADHQAFILKNYTNMIMFHLLSNTFLNFFNLFLCKTHSSYNTSVELQALMPFYIFKLLCNSLYLVLLMNNVERIANMLLISYTFQIMLFGLMIYAFTQTENDINSGFMVMLNVVSGGADALFRFIIERRIRNRVNVVR